MYQPQYPSQDQLNDDIVLDLTKYFPTRVIIAGSRGFNNFARFDAIIRDYIKDLKGPILFYTGMAPTGPDNMIVRWCGENDYRYFPFKADWDRFGKGAGFIRNTLMAMSSPTGLLAIWDMNSPGTKHMIDQAQAQHIRTEIVNVSAESNPRILRLYTIQLSQWRIAQKLNIKFIDITAKSGIAAFAPLIDNVIKYKEGAMHPDEYERLYRDKMTQSLIDFPKHWNRLKDFDEMAFACYCRPGDFCHRHIFVELAKNYLEQNYLRVELGGEILSDIFQRIEQCQVTGVLPQKCV